MSRHILSLSHEQFTAFDLDGSCTATVLLIQIAPKRGMISSCST
jgi:hypothetical protein